MSDSHVMFNLNWATWFFLTGTGTNVCYMEELKNIKKTGQKKGPMEREEGKSGREENKVEGVS